MPAELGLLQLGLLNMTTLAESFLADLDDLSDDSDRDQNDQQQEDGDADQVSTAAAKLDPLRGGHTFMCGAYQSAMQMVVDDIEKLKYDSLENVAHLKASERYRDIMQVCRHCTEHLFRTNSPLCLHGLPLFCNT